MQSHALKKLALNLFLHILFEFILNMVISDVLFFHVCSSGIEVIFFPFLQHLKVFPLDFPVLNVGVWYFYGYYAFKNDVEVFPLVAKLYDVFHDVHFLKHDVLGYLLQVFWTQRLVLSEEFLLS